MLKKILIGLAVLVAGFFGYAATQPDNYKVTRKIEIAAPPSTVFSEVNSLKRFGEWSPWEKLDPAMKKSWSGPESGVGSAYAWEGNDKVGQGKMTIASSETDKKVSYNLEFIKPFASTAVTDMTINGAAAPVTVEWTMTGKQNLMGKAMGVFMNMDKMIGKDFENGLSNLKTVAEKAAKDAAAAPPPAVPPTDSPAPPPPADGAAPPAPAPAEGAKTP
jgi:hypothetical protein